MVNIRYSNLLYNIITLINKKSFIFFAFIQIKLAFSEYFDSFQQGNISNNASIIDITDYNNLYPLITTDKQIYAGMTPIKLSETNASIINISTASTYDNNTILLACSENYLLSEIDIYMGEEIFLLSYDNFILSKESLNYSCSICYSNDTVYIGIIKIINNTIQKNVIKLELENQYDNKEITASNQYEKSEIIENNE